MIVKILNINKFLLAGLMLVFSTISSFATESASVNLSFQVNRYLQIDTLTSPVLTANITDRTGNLYSPLYSKFKVVSNTAEPQELFLHAHANTDNGAENAMFEMNGNVYIAFTYVQEHPKSQALANCKMGSNPDGSPGVVAYPITSIEGINARYLRGKNKYSMSVKNGTTYIKVNIGSSVLQNSFATNDPNGFYQATLLLTEADI